MLGTELVIKFCQHGSFYMLPEWRITSVRSNDIDFFKQDLESMLLGETIRVVATPEDCFST